MQTAESTTTGTSEDGPSPFAGALDRLQQPTAFDNVFQQGRESFVQGRSSALKGWEQGKTQLNTLGSNMKTNINQFVEKSQDKKIPNKEDFQNFGEQLKTNVSQFVEQQQQNTTKGRESLRNFGQQLKSNITQFVEEQQQPSGGLSSQLNALNLRMKEEAERRDVQKVSEEACKNEMRNHLEEFVKKNPNGTYEQWIEDLHPENLSDPKLLKEMDKELDLRFYVEESDHLRLWNEKIRDPLRQVKSRNRVWKDDTKTQLNSEESAHVDLLGGDEILDNEEKKTDSGTSTEPTKGGDVDLISF